MRVWPCLTLAAELEFQRMRRVFLVQIGTMICEAPQFIPSQVHQGVGSSTTLTPSLPVSRAAISMPKPPVCPRPPPSPPQTFRRNSWLDPKHPRIATGAAVAPPKRLQARAVLQLARWVAGQGQSGYSDLKVLFDQAVALEPGWDKSHFHYARWVRGGDREARKAGCLEGHDDGTGQ